MARASIRGMNNTLHQREASWNARFRAATPHLDERRLLPDLLIKSGRYGRWYVSRGFAHTPTGAEARYTLNELWGTAWVLNGYRAYRVGEVWRLDGLDFRQGHLFALPAPRQVAGLNFPAPADAAMKRQAVRMALRCRPRAGQTICLPPHIEDFRSGEALLRFVERVTAPAASSLPAVA